MTLNKRAILYAKTPTPIGSTKKEENGKEIWCKVEDIGIRAKYTALSAGISLDKKILIRKTDYSADYTNAIVGGIDYAIDSATYAGNALFISLQLKRG